MNVERQHNRRGSNERYIERQRQRRHHRLGGTGATAATSSTSTKSKKHKNREPPKCVTHYLNMALEISNQNWNMLGLNDRGCPNVAAVHDIDILAERITSLLLVRLIALGAPSNSFQNLSTTCICKTLLLSTTAMKCFYPLSLNKHVIKQQEYYVKQILRQYHEVPYHGFEHAYQVLIASHKMLDLILQQRSKRKSLTMAALTAQKGSAPFEEDPLLQLALLYAALIHDVDHQGVPNQQLITENSPLVKRYDGKSIAEHRSLEIGSTEMLKFPYNELRKYIFSYETTGDDGAHRRFWGSIKKVVLATDISSKERSGAVLKHWKHAFGGENADTYGYKEMPTLMNRRGSSGPGRSRSPLTRNRRGSAASSGRSSPIVSSKFNKQQQRHTQSKKTLQRSSNKHRRRSSLDNDRKPIRISSFEAKNNNIKLNNLLMKTNSNHNKRPSIGMALDQSSYHHQALSVTSGHKRGSNMEASMNGSFAYWGFNRLFDDTFDDSEDDDSFGSTDDLLICLESDVMPVEFDDDDISMMEDPAVDNYDTRYRYDKKNESDFRKSLSDTTAATASTGYSTSNFILDDHEDDDISISIQKYQYCTNENISISLMEHILLVADVGHNVQGWELMLKWAKRLSQEHDHAVETGRSTDDKQCMESQLMAWYNSQIGFLQGYVMPLAKRLEKTGYVPRRNEYGLPFLSSIVEDNCNRWRRQGRDILLRWMEKEKLLVNKNVRRRRYEMFD